jgi:lipoyl(octanoyl) transferase
MGLRHIKLGRISFDDALSRQDEAISRYRETGEGLPLIFSLEHEPVITCGKSTDRANLLLSEEEYLKHGIAVRETDRGGDVTYHGPGQIVVYPIIDLKKLGMRAGEFVRLLEEAMILTCRDYGVEAFRRDRMHGCWTGKGKIGAVGTAVKSGGITKHGIAFNVNPDMRNFALIVPCGISGYQVAKLEDFVDGPVDMSEVEERLVEHVAGLLGLSNEKDPGR